MQFHLTRFCIALRTILTIFVTTMFVTGTGAFAKEKVLYNFSFNGTDGYQPISGLIADSSGNLYGTTYQGGNSSNCTNGCGTVYELKHEANGTWSEKVLHNFTNSGGDGYSPWASLVMDPEGNLYGTAGGGGAYDYGIVFELKRKPGGTWKEKILHNFNFNGTDGVGPTVGLALDAAGNLYGTTQGGGANVEGAVYELSPTAHGLWTETILHSFNNDGTDGFAPYSTVILDASGNVYGTTSEGGPYNQGTVYELSPSGGGAWTETILYSFSYNYPSGEVPNSILFDASGNLYGTTASGTYPFDGTVFELSPSAGGWTEMVLHYFKNSAKGGDLPNGLVFDTAGNLYGVTYDGGIYAEGNVYKLSPNGDGTWSEGITHNFSNDGVDGFFPNGGLIIDAAGKLFGTTASGGTGGQYFGGTVFEVVP
jgi:uncharacterized repeat protein (TIGR03803 family)